MLIGLMAYKNNFGQVNKFDNQLSSFLTCLVANVANTDRVDKTDVGCDRSSSML